MKDFIKWLGVNEKIAKVVVWLLIIMVILILTNTMLESIGFPHYAITYDNLRELKSTKALNYITSWITAILNFYAILLLVFRTKEARKLLKYAIVYLLINIIITTIFNTAIAQLFIIIFVILLCYL